MKKLTLLLPLLLIGCASSRIIGLTVTKDEINAAIDSEDPYEKVMFNNFCEDGKQKREFVVKAILPVGRCAGYMPDKSKEMHDEYLKMMEMEAVSEVTDLLSFKREWPKYENFDREDGDYFKNQCGVPYRSKSFFNSENEFYLDGGSYEEETPKKYLSSEYVFLSGYAIKPTEKEAKQIVTPRDTSIYRPYRTPMDYAMSRHATINYVQEHYKMSKSVTKTEIIYTFSYDLNDFCSRGRLKKEIVE